MPQRTGELPDWDDLLSSAARLQEIVPGAVMAAAIHAGHRISIDHDHVLNNLRGHFSEILADLESVAGWKTARVARPVLILGRLDGIETGVRQLIREAPLETETMKVGELSLEIPTAAETLRIKAILILKRNATRDYVDFAALADRLGPEETASALRDFDRLYPQPGGESPLQQLHAQLANALPYDLEETDLSEYKELDPRWHQWEDVKQACANAVIALFDRVCEKAPPHSPAAAGSRAVAPPVPDPSGGMGD